MQKIGSLAVLLALTTACTYISNDKEQEKIANLDQDNDGDPFKSDCDDLDGDRFHDAVEIPYDGIDNDCDDKDLLDADGDGFAGISKAEYDATAKNPSLWTSEFGEADEDKDCRDDVEVEPAAASINPGVLPSEDLAYDGIDADCAGDNDYDEDGDGYTRVGYDDDFAAYLVEWDLTLSSVLGGGDCDDSKTTVNPGAATDTPYDGEDTNCDAQNDFDLDNDGFLADGTTETEYADYEAEYSDEPGFLTLVAYQDGDCLDDDDANLPSTLPADVNPDADEVFYDGVDGNCNADNDFDQDGDGFVREGDDADYETYKTNWGFDDADLGFTGFDDCDDKGNGAELVFPGAIEILGDNTDQDCNDNDETADFLFDTFLWTEPGEPVATANNLHFIITTTAERYELPPSITISPNFFGAIVFDVSDPVPTEPLVMDIAGGVSNIFSTDHDVVAVQDGFWMVSSTFPLPIDEIDNDSASGTAKTSVYKATFNAANDKYESGSGAPFAFANYDDNFTDFDLALDDDDNAWFVGCGSDEDTHVGIVVSPPSNIFDEEENDDNRDFCILEHVSDGVAVATACDAGGCVLWDANASDLSDDGSDEISLSGDTAPDWTPISVDNHNGVIAVVDIADGMLVVSDDDEWETFDGDTLLDGDAVIGGTNLFAAAILDDGTVELQYGDPDKTLSSTELPFNHSNSDIEPERIAVYANNTHVLVAVTGSDSNGDGAVGWLFLQQPN
jgi:hypothetical protein